MNQVLKKNYQLELDKLINKIEGNDRVPSLMLHSCCGPCSSYVLEYLSEFFSITVLYYNPNIYPSEEYWYRVDEQQKIIDLTNAKNPIKMITGRYDTERFYDMARGMEEVKEGGSRCHRCYEMRLRKTAEMAKKEGFDYFTTTLTISPHKDSQVLNRIAEDIACQIGVKNLPSDFKKKGGYKRSCEITREHGLYRQDYCGCVYSKMEMEERNLSKDKKKLREYIKEVSGRLDEEYMRDSENVIFDKLFNSSEYKKAKTVFAYVGVNNELDTSKFINQALLDGKKVCIPYCKDKDTMLAYEVDSLDSLIKNDYGILEPDPSKSKLVEKDDIDYILVPSCTVDKDGNRLGFGRGYYDRFLKEYRGYMVLAIRSRQMSENVPTGPKDIRIKNIVTEL